MLGSGCAFLCPNSGEEVDRLRIFRILQISPTIFLRIDPVSYAAEIPDDPTPEAPRPPDPAKPTPGGPTLPQTGQVWWPVPLLLMTGLLLLAVGLFRRRTTGDER